MDIDFRIRKFLQQCCDELPPKTHAQRADDGDTARPAPAGAPSGKPIGRSKYVIVPRIQIVAIHGCGHPVDFDNHFAVSGAARSRKACRLLHPGPHMAHFEL